jgi:glycosyltransferase involved in cell wall biosynthesis
MTAAGAALSVIIPAYKSSGTIARAIDSVLDQTHRADEILIIDDGSPEDLASAIAVYGDKVRLRRKANGGAASARNFGLENCTGELVAFLDADDCWEPAKLEKQVRCASRIFVQLAGGRRLAGPKFPQRYLGQVLRPSGAEAFRMARFTATSTTLIRRSALGTHRFDASLRTAEDVDFYLKLILMGPVFIVDEPLATLVLTAGSLSRSDVADDHRNMLQVVQRYAGLLGRADKRVEEVRVYRDWAACHLGEENARAALGPAWQRLVRQPWSLQAWWILLKAGAWSALPSWRKQP